MWTSAFQVLETEVRLQADDPELGSSRPSGTLRWFDEAAELERTLAALTATYGAPAGGEPLCYAFDVHPWPRLHRDGRIICVVDEPVDLPPIFEHDLYQQVLARSAGVAVHAAALAGPAGALLLVGPSGSGKSTLALALTQRGARYITDDTATIHADQTVRGICRPIGVDAEPDALPGGFGAVSYAYRSRVGDRERATLVHPPADHLCHIPVALDQIVLLRHVPAAEPGLERLAGAAALSGLWPSVVSQGAGALQAVTALVDRWPIHRLTTRSVEQACVDLATLWPCR